MSEAIAAPDIPAFLDRRPLVYTYTILNNYRNVCPHQMFRRYIARDQPYVETPEMKWGNQVHSAFEFRIGSGKPLPDGMQQWEKFAAPFDSFASAKARAAGKPRTISVEQKLAITKDAQPCDYWAKDVWLRGKLDLTAIEGDTAYMADWKTGGSKYEDPFELEVGAVLLKLNKKHLTKIVGNYVWLKEERLGQRYDLSAFRQTWDEINRIVALIERDRSAEGGFEKRKSGLCGWCSVSDCENHYVAKK